AGPFHPRLRAHQLCDMRYLSLVLLTAAGCHLAGNDSASPPDAQNLTEHRLATGARLDPVGSVLDLGSLPLAMVPSPDGKHFVVVNSGYGDQGFQIVERATGKVVQTVVQPA